MQYVRNFDRVTKKFYDKDVFFTYFSNIDDENIEKLDGHVNYITSITSRDYIYKDGFDKLLRYSQALQYLNSQATLSFDEKVFILIKALDPNLYIYKSFIATPFITNSQIESCEDEIEKRDLRTQKEVILNEFIRNIRNELGFYESKLIKYEKFFYNKYYVENKDYLMDEVQFGNIPYELETDSEVFEKVSLLVDDYKTKFNGNIKSLEKILIKEPSILGVSDKLEAYLFYILLLDPELRMLHLYEEESNWKYIEQRFKEEFGYFSMNLYYLEKAYAKANNIEIESFFSIKK